MENIQTVKSQLANKETIIFPVERTESAENWESIDFSAIPNNKLDTRKGIQDDFVSELHSSPQSSEFSDCFKNPNCMYNLSAKLNQEIEKESFAIRKGVLDSMISGILNENYELCEIPLDCSFSDL